ncbi:MAG: hypothetical protein JNM63_18295, partial [Spirochaetia bacterium]|nr:hypothetical protein [Spirochaetia bacterium]
EDYAWLRLLKESVEKNKGIAGKTVLAEKGEKVLEKYVGAVLASPDDLAVYLEAREAILGAIAELSK